MKRHSGASSRDESPRILVVDDDDDVRWLLKRYLGGHGLTVEAVADGAAMRHVLAARSFDLVVLDLGLPGEDGLTLARYLREHHDVAIVMLTAAAEVVDRVIGLELGADDYVTKPFEPRELLARIKSVLRRVRAAASKARAVAGAGRVRFGKRVLDLEAYALYDENDNEIRITSMEFDLLKAFAEHPNRVLSRDQLLNLAHNRDWEPFDRSIDIRIARLRRKVEPDPAKPQVIKTVRGVGYMFVPGGGD